MDPSTAIDAEHRELADVTHDGKPAQMLIAERTYAAPIDDVWDALTNPERIPRWFLPITGQLELDGRYQLEGNASGTITVCDAPTHLAVTWEMGGGVTWVDLHLAANGDETTLRLEHVALMEDLEQFREFGPGAVGVGWDGALMSLAMHLAGGAANPDPTDPALREFYRRSSEAWGRAAIAYGTPADVAEAAAARTTEFYTGG
jgi:uncharacterized protein YndB with AHSA1/START domain